MATDAAPRLPAATPRRGGRPSRQQAEQIREQILGIATDLFLTQGYGATSIELVAQRARISKRTFYHRFRDKADLFGAVVHRLIEHLRPPKSAVRLDEGSLGDVLERLAGMILRAALSPDALALHRVIVAEATRFPELAAVLDEQGARREALRTIAALLEREVRRGRLEVEDAAFAAEQFLHMVVAAPQRRALGLGKPMTAAELELWARRSVQLFLNGCRGRLESATADAPHKSRARH
ncbi:MAG TPA: TetR/AcrR family transcriptional regulator [Alphaproteobacteria bacterium]|nr:TetR/AcrR family transcriptional regulator [Alphaproteobacteria bacterium]